MFVELAENKDGGGMNSRVLKRDVCGFHPDSVEETGRAFQRSD